jgi:hypothetical protein
MARTGRFAEVDSALARAAGLGNIEVSEEQKTKAARAVAGSNACRGAGDAKELLEAIGLYEFVIGESK